MLGGSTQYAGAWGDNGQGREDRALKHRSSRSVRPVPACPQLVRILRHHLDTYTCGPDGRLFVTRTGTQRHPVSGGYAGPVSGSSYGNTWRKARTSALTKAEAASPLARRPYDLRHACVSLWLNAGVPATQVAEWAGHSVAVLLRVYAKCIAGQEDSAQQRVDVALNSSTNSPQTPVDDRTVPDTAG
jgi:integrase